VKRNATDCRINWVANRHPRINHAEWLPAELSTLKSFVSAYQQRNIPVDWVEVSEKLGVNLRNIIRKEATQYIIQTNRIPIECMRQTLSRLRHNWIPDADQRLTRAVETYGIDNWQLGTSIFSLFRRVCAFFLMTVLVAREVSENATATQCQKRWYKSLDPSVKHGPWTAEEDDRLRKAVAGYDSSWIQVAATIPGRTNDQCRERWMERLQRGAQHDWTEDEDKILLDSVREIGNKWKEISMRIGNQKTGQAVGSMWISVLFSPDFTSVSSASQQVEKSCKESKTLCCWIVNIFAYAFNTGHTNCHHINVIGHINTFTSGKLKWRSAKFCTKPVSFRSLSGKAPAKSKTTSKRKRKGTCPDGLFTCCQSTINHHDLDNIGRHRNFHTTWPSWNRHGEEKAKDGCAIINGGRCFTCSKEDT